MAVLDSVSAWISGTAFSQAVRAHDWIVPAVQTIHILAIAVVMGTVVLVDLRMLGVIARTQSPDSVARRLIPPLWPALGVLFVTGCVLISGEPNRSLTNPAFQLKMLMLICVVGLTLLLLRLLNRADSPSSRLTTPPAIKAVALASLALWFAIIFAGRLIAYVE